MLEIFVGIILILVSVFLIIAVLFQSSKNAHLSGAIAGGAETFFGKAKGKKLDAKLNKLTIVISILFTIVVLAIYAIQPGKAKITYDYSALKDYIAGVENGSISITVTEEEEEEEDHDHGDEDTEGTEGTEGTEE